MYGDTCQISANPLLRTHHSSLLGILYSVITSWLQSVSYIGLEQIDASANVISALMVMGQSQAKKTMADSGAMVLQ